MNLPKPLGVLFTVVGLYAITVLVFRFKGTDMGWGPALLISLVAVPVVLFVTWAQENWNGPERGAPRRPAGRSRAPR